MQKIKMDIHHWEWYRGIVRILSNFSRVKEDNKSHED